MYIHTTSTRKAPRRLLSSLTLASIAPTRTFPRPSRYVSLRNIATTQPTEKQPKPSVFRQFFGLTPKRPPSVDASQALRDTADTLRALLSTNPPARLALLRKPYNDLSNAASAYRTTVVDPLDLTTVGTGMEQAISRLAGDSLSRDDPLAYLSVLLQRLSSSSHTTSEDLELALRVYAEMQPIFGRTPRRNDILCLARARAMLRQPTEAIEIASALVPPPESNSDVWPLIACAVILHSEDRGTNAADEIRRFIQKMADLGVEPPPGAWCALLGTLPPQEVSAVLKVLPESVSEEPRIWATTLEVLLEAGDEQLRKEVAEKIEAIVRTQNVLDTHVWAPLALYVGRVESQEDKNATYEMLRAFNAAGGLPDTVLLTALLRALPLSEQTPNTLRRLENETGVPADERVWSVLVDAVLKRIGEEIGPEPEDTSIMGVWDAAAESGVNLTSTVLDRVLAREDVSIVDRLRAYKAVHASWPAEKERERSDDEEGTDIDRWMRREDTLTTPGPTVKTYSTLLKALVAREGNELDKTTASAVAVEILTDMRQRGIRFPHIAQASNLPPRAGKAGGPTIPTPLSPLASLTILLMRNAPSHEAAFKTYAYACVIDPSSHSFGEREYRAILKNFAGLKIQRDEEQLLREGGGDQWREGASIEAILGRRTDVYAPPPAALYYEIMRDMQRAGYSIQQTEYSAILRAYANTCLAPPEETDSTTNEMLPKQTRNVATSATLARAHNSHVLEHIQRIHTLLKLDTNLTPDTELLNSLMLAYGHAGAIENVLAIWDQMADRRWGSASASIVIDALGRSGRSNLNRARMLWDSLRRYHGSKLTVNIYTSWVEALCRLGEFAEAERVVFVDMRGHVRPDEKTLRTLVSFAWRVGRQAQVLEDVRKQFPGVI
ncbi:hypothetical protein ACGC1H_006574 [Rhizoctonia solani]|uniref:Uncharacterized protein n=1 Tax=Rhizoctonia solani TaxID=456999 RepID=A0A8H3GHM9_9AGAM|nr:unnamed protein product [Rhizoctonia solani]